MKISVKQKITVTFSVLAGFLVLLGTFITFFILDYGLRYKSYNVLEDSVRDFSADYSQNLLQEKEISYQKEVPESEDSSYYNIRNEEYSEGKIDSVEDIDIDKLEASKEVYSRLVSPNGAVTFTSDLFETYEVDPDKMGKNEYNYGPICVHSLTQKTENGDILQVARYCPLSRQNAEDIFKAILAGSLIVLVSTYFFGLLLSTIILKPLENEVDAHKRFIQDARHELITPLSIAISTVDASLIAKNYREGLEELKGELKNAYGTLNVLVQKYIHGKVPERENQVGIKSLAEDIFEANDKSVRERNLNVKISGEEVMVEVNKDIVRSVLRNIIENAITHSLKGKSIEAVITEGYLKVVNEFDMGEGLKKSDLFRRGKKDKGSNGKGVGLTLAREFCELVGWEMAVDVKNGVFEVRVEW